MLKSKIYKNETIATPHGNVEFNHEGVAKANKDSELLLSKFSGFEYVEEKVEKPVTEKKTETVKKAPVKRAPRKKASDKKEDEK